MMWEVPARIVRVIDGDTVVCDADLGWHIHTLTAVRVYGIDAPEVSTAAGLEAKKYAQSLLTPDMPVRLISRKLLGSFDKYGRVLADLLYGPLTEPRSDEGSFALAMIAAGHAKPWYGEGVKPG